MDACHLAQTYVSYLKEVRGVCTQNVRASSLELERFLAYLCGADATDLAVVAPSEVERYLTTRCAHLKPASARRVVSLLKDFFAFLAQRQLIPHNPIALFPLPKLPQGTPLPKALTVEEVDALFSATSHNPDPFLAARDFALLAALYALALRASEAVQLTLRDVNLLCNVVTVRHSKTGRQRQLPLPQAVRQAFARYLAYRHDFAAKSNVSSQAFFLSRRGGPLHPHTLWLWLDTYRKKAGIPRKISPHQLRHSCATHMIADSGWPLPLVSQWLGHQKHDSTLLYTHLLQDDLASAITRHPRRLKGDAL